jgi:hypothetical protein
MSVCLEAYNQGSREARYLVTINWNGMSANQYHRLDIGAEDASGATWPQLRDGRLRSRSRPTHEQIVVADVTRYPLQFVLLGFSHEGAVQFDSACQDGFCSVRLPVDGITEIDMQESAAIPSAAGAPRCE